MLSPEHTQLIRESAIAQEVAETRGYRTVSTKSDLEALGFRKAQRIMPTLLIPVWNVHGQISTCQHRPDQPRINKGKPLKYETPVSSRMVLDVPPAVQGKLADPKIPLYITERASKADSAVFIGLCCISLAGVWNWRGTNEKGGKTALPDWESIALNGRKVYVAFDSDVMEKSEVRGALTRLQAFLASRGADTREIRLPVGESGRQTGLDDFLASGMTVHDLLALATKETSKAGIVADDPAESVLLEAHFADHGNAERLMAFAGDDLRYWYAFKKWVVWDGGRWKRSENGEEMAQAKRLVRRLHKMTSKINDDDRRTRFAENALSLESVRKCGAMLEAARDLQVVPVESLDTHSNLFNVRNGTIDLITLTLRTADRADLLTQQAGAAYDPEAKCPIRDAFLEKIFDGKAEMVSFLTRCAGYSLTGGTEEQCFFMLHGDGANGKSTLIECLMTLFGGYAQKTSAATFLQKKQNAISEDLASLRGVRLAGAVEPDAGRAMAEAVVKEATGGDTIRARKLYENSSEYRPQFKLWLACNRLPRVRGTDHGIWRRILTIPFRVVINEAERDRDLPGRLRDELAGILNWCLQGLEVYYERDLASPVEAQQDKAQYRNAEDQMGRFISETCVESPDAQARNKDLRMAYERWCDHNGESPFSSRVFKPELERRGFEQVKVNGWPTWKGIGVANDRPDEERFDHDAGMQAAGEKEANRLI